MNALKIVDVSKHNKVTDWAVVKAAGIDGVIIRAGYGRYISQKDKAFEQFYSGASEAGLHIGAYWYSYADNATEAAAEASVFMQAVKDKKFDLPLYYDIEEQKHVALGRNICTSMATAFCKTLENAGYYAGVYSFDSFFSSSLDADIQNRFATWTARVENIAPKCCLKWGMHQYSWKGSIDGIVGNVDMNNCIRDYPTIIRNAGLNGYKKIPSYSVTARMAGLPKAKAQTISDACAKMGMTVIFEED